MWAPNVLKRVFFRTLVLLALLISPAHAQETDFSGEWQTFWRTGAALLSLEQQGSTVTGTYQPENGRVSGIVEGRILSGSWVEDGASGSFIFALSDDGGVLTGRFGNGEYWNGFRESAHHLRSDLPLSNASPRAVLESLLIAANAALYGGDARGLRRIGELVTFESESGQRIEYTRQRTLMFEILDLSTLRLIDVPDGPTSPGDTSVVFELGPSANAVRTKIEFRLEPAGGWRLVLPSVAELTAERDRILEALGAESTAEWDIQRSNSARHAMREFVLGANSWDQGGRARTLNTMDMSGIPERLHDLEGPIFADFLKRIIDRVGYVIWQEIPDDPGRATPYVFFQHPLGNVTVAPVAQPLPLDAEPGAVPVQLWMITSETLATAPRLLEAMKDLPTATGLVEPAPLSAFFRVREAVRSIAPDLLMDWGYLEVWQWLGIGLSIVAAWVACWGIRALFRRVGNADGLALLGSAVGLLAAACILFLSVVRLGITQVGLPFVGSVAGIFVIIALAFVSYRLASLIGGWFQERASGTVGYLDEIAASLGTGLTKLLIIVTAIIAIADVAGLPYEGVLTGLGIGGLAIAFAARDTVSNMLGGGILVADRPFNRGDLIEIDGNMATVEQVGLRSTRLRSLDDTVLHVPNSQLSDRVIANWGKRRRRKLLLQVGLTYDTPEDKLETFTTRLRETVLAQPRIDADEVYVGLKNFGASSIDIEVYSYFRVFGYAAQVEAHNALMMDIIALAREVGVDFAFPTRTVHVSSSGGASSTSQFGASAIP